MSITISNSHVTYGSKLVGVQNLELMLDAANLNSYPESGTVWYDVSGNDNNATMYNVTHYANNPKAMIYDASGDRCETASTFFASPTSMSMSAWFNMTGGTGTYRCVIHKGTVATVGGSQYWLGVSGAGNLVATIGANSVGWAAGDTLSACTLGQWYNVTCTWNGSVVRTYIDGEFSKQYNLGTLTNQTATTKIGASGTGTYQVLGLISTVYMWYNYSLNDSEVKLLYEVHKSRFGY